MKTLPFLASVFVMSGLTAVANAGTPLRSIEASEDAIFQKESKKVTLTVVVDPSVSRMNLVQVDEQGRKLKLIGVMDPGRKAEPGTFHRKVQLYEMNTGRLFFTAVDDAELETFEPTSRPVAEIHVHSHPSLPEILRGIWNKLWNQGRGTASAEGAPCFDFSKPVKEALGPVLSIPTGADASSSGARKEGGVWAAARGIVDVPVKDVLKSLLDFRTIKGKDMKAELKKESRPGFLAFHELKIKIYPLPFISIGWTEQWAYVITKGTAADPQEVVISFQKSGGDDRLKRLCGSIRLEKIGSGTDVSLYEEVDAPRRSAEDLLAGHLGTLRTLRTGK